MREHQCALDRTGADAHVVRSGGDVCAAGRHVEDALGQRESTHGETGDRQEHRDHRESMSVVPSVSNATGAAMATPGRRSLSAPPTVIQRKSATPRATGTVLTIPGRQPAR